MPGLNAITIIVTFMCLLNTTAALVKAFNCTQPKIYNRTAYIECSSEAADKMNDCKFYINTHNLTVIENANEMTTTRLDGLFQNNCSLQIPLLNLGPGQHQISARMTLDTATGEMVDISSSVEIELKSTLENVVCDSLFFMETGQIVVCSADMVYLDINCDFNSTMRGVVYHNPRKVSYSSDILREDNTLVYKDRCTLYIAIGWQSYSLNMKLMNGSDIIEVKNSAFSSEELAFDPVCKSEMSLPMYPGDTRTCKCKVTVLGSNSLNFEMLEEYITNLTQGVLENPDTALNISFKDVENHKNLFCGPVTRTGRSNIFVAYIPTLLEQPKITYFHAIGQNNDKAGDGGKTDLVVDLDSDVLFNCSAEGHPTPFLALVKNKGEESNDEFFEVLKYVKKMKYCRDAGQYSCEAYNYAFNVTSSNPINVYIRCPQELYDTQTKTWYGLIMGTQGRVSVPLFGYPAPTKLKLEKQHDANMTDFKVVYTDTSMLTGNVTVIFTTVEEKHIGVYTLTVGNGIGTDFSYDFRVYKDSTNKLMSSYGVLYLAMFLWALVWKLA